MYSGPSNRSHPWGGTYTLPPTTTAQPSEAKSDVYWWWAWGAMWVLLMPMVKVGGDMCRSVVSGAGRWWHVQVGGGMCSGGAGGGGGSGGPSSSTPFQSLTTRTSPQAYVPKSLPTPTTTTLNHTYTEATPTTQPHEQAHRLMCPNHYPPPPPPDPTNTLPQQPSQTTHYSGLPFSTQGWHPSRVLASMLPPNLSKLNATTTAHIGTTCHTMCNRNLHLSSTSSSP